MTHLSAIKTKTIPATLLVIMILASSAHALDCTGPFTDTLDEQVCFEKNARATNDYKACFSAPYIESCVVNLAAHYKDPSAILELTESEGDEITVFTESDRYNMLAQYIKITGDISAWPLIKDNRLYDYAVLNTPAKVYAGTGYIPNDDYCDNLKGNYGYDEQLNHDQTAEEEASANKRVCESMVSALRQIKLNNQACREDLIKRLDGATELRQKSAIEGCEELIAQIREGILKIDRRVDRWVLVDTEVNPKKQEKEFIVGVTPNYYSKKYDGSYEKYGVESSSISYDRRSVDDGNELYHAKFSANFKNIPTNLIPGETKEISASFTGSGTATEEYRGSCSAAIRFEFRAEGISLKGDTKYTMCMDYKENTITSTFVVPKTNSGKINIDAFFWNCAACWVRFVYEKNKVLVPEASADDADIDLEMIAPYFDVKKIDAREENSDFIESADDIPPAASKAPEPEKKGLISRLISWLKRLF